MFNLKAPLRIQAPIVFNQQTSTRKSAVAPHKGTASAPKKTGDPYLARLVLLIPSEVIALYLAFKETAAAFIGVWALICFVLVIFVRNVGTHKSGNPIQIGAILIAYVSFVLWAYATDGYFFNFKLPSTMPGGISVAIRAAGPFSCLIFIPAMMAIPNEF